MGLTLLEEELKDREGAASQDESEELLLVHSIQRNTQSAVDVLNDLLNYDKIEGGNLSLELELVDVWQLIATTVSEFKLSANSKGIHLAETIDNDKAPHLLRVVADPIRLVQVLRNLISNAVKFTPKEGMFRFRLFFVSRSMKSILNQQLQRYPCFLSYRNNHCSCPVGRASTRKDGTRTRHDFAQGWPRVAG
jgi:signal transduction histidine kinase